MKSRNVRLTKECLRAVQAHPPFNSLEDRRLLQQVAGPDATVNDYLYGGFGTSVGIRAALHSIGISLYDCERILDFGCGPARIIRWFRDTLSYSRLYACDINRPAIEWCQANIDYAEFTHTPAWPPLPYADQMFDLVYGISVFTHLDESMHVAWLQELFRITKPGGIVLLSIHGADKAASDLSPSEYEYFIQNGFLYKAATEKVTVEGLPEFYQVAFHSESYVRSAWTQQFDAVGYVTHGCMYAQDLVILRAKRQGNVERAETKRPTTSIRSKLPLAAFETPLIGTAVGDTALEREFEVRGWAFNPDGKVPQLEVWIDGNRVGSCIPSGPRPVVLNAFPTTPAAAQSGFFLKCPTSGLEKGAHILWLTQKNDPTPLWATFFHCSIGSWRRRRTRLIWELRCKLRLRTRLRALFYN